MEVMTGESMNNTERKSELDLDKLLAKAEIGALFLDRDLRVRRVTSIMSKYVAISDSDVGKLLLEMPVLEQYGDFKTDIERCMTEQMELEREIGREGNTFLLHICPYQNEQGEADGVLVILSDITGRQKKVEEQRNVMGLKLNYDSLTGLPVYNRFIINAREYLAHYGNDKLCCVYSDFSGFQYYNEVYGYEKGDGILKRFADALTERYGQCGLFSHVNSDHFVGLVQGMTIQEAAEDYKDFTVSFTEECNKEFTRTNLVLASGIYSAEKSDFSITVMVDNANEARKKCKEQTAVTMVKVYTDSLRHEVENAKTINSNILNGLKNKEFYAYMQPKVGLKSGKVEGAEALVRWIRPDGTRVMPDEFIGIAEKNGYVTKIDFEVLDQTLQYLADAMEKGEEVVPISVNFSRRNNEYSDFVPNILESLKKYNVPSHLLEAEITESVFMADLSTVDDNMNMLRKQGVEISVDDFGSGYSSLNMLAKVSADTIKLDRLFLNNAKKDEKGLTVIQYLTRMLKSLGFTVLAEGVETEEQLDWLKKADCDLVQGFYYAKPMSIPDFRKFIKEFNSRADHIKAITTSCSYDREGVYECI